MKCGPKIWEALIKSKKEMDPNTTLSTRPEKELTHQCQKEYSRSKKDRAKFCDMYECVYCVCCMTPSASHWWNLELALTVLTHAHRRISRFMGPAHRGMSTLGARDHRALPRPPHHEMHEMLSQGTPSSQSHREHEGPGGRDAQGCSAHVRDECASSQVLQTRRNTTNCLPPSNQEVHEKFGLVDDLMTSAHEMTPRSDGKDWRGGQCASQNILLYSMGAAQAAGTDAQGSASSVTGLSHSHAPTRSRARWLKTHPWRVAQLHLDRCARPFYLLRPIDATV